MDDPSEPVGDWREYQRLILSELRRGARERAALAESVNGLTVELAKLKATAAMWGAIGGALIGAVVSFVSALISR